MKSIVEQSSSIASAIEKGWIRAGKPAHFSVQIFELPIKNFFGLTTKPAKVGILFAEINNNEKKKDETKRPKYKKNTQAHNSSLSSTYKQKSQISTHPNNKDISKITKPSKKEITKNTFERKSSSSKVITSDAWPSNKIDYVIKSLLEITSILNIDHGLYLQKQSNNTLYITFKKRFLNNKYKERQFFQNCTYILTALLRNKFKDDNSNLRLILSCKPD